MNYDIKGFRRRLWQWEEYLRVSRMMFRIAIANDRRVPIVEKKIRFGPHPRQFAVLHYDRASIGQDKPIVFFLHGGGWGWGNPHLYRFVGRFFVEAGYPAILGGYRHTPFHRFPSQLNDAYAGLKAGLDLASSRGILRQAPQKNIGTSQDKLGGGSVILAGQSAGAQLASLMLLDRENLQDHGFRTESFAGLLLISGLLNFTHCRNWKDRDMLHRYLGKRKNWDRADPIRFVRGDEKTPVLCIHGERDLLVDSANSISFIRRLNGTGEIYIAPNAYHTDLTTMFLQRTPSTEVMLRWLDKVGKVDSDPPAGTSQ